MNTSVTEPNQGVPEVLGDSSAPDDFPCASHLYLLLHTRALENWAYRPSPPDSSVNIAVAPGVVDLVRAVNPLAMRRWLWEDLPEEIPERGPLLVEVTDDASLIEHAKTIWAPADGVLLIGSQADMDTLHRHLMSLVRIVMPDQGAANFTFGPSQLAAWLNALDADHRHAWLGPITQLLWRDQLGPAHQWYRLEQTAAAPAQRSANWLHLRTRELAAFDHYLHEHFVVGLANELQALPDYSEFSAAQLQSSVCNTLEQGHQINILAEEDLRNYVLLRARYRNLRNDPETQRLLNDLNEPPSARLRAVTALAENKEVQQ